MLRDIAGHRVEEVGGTLVNRPEDAEQHVRKKHATSITVDEVAFEPRRRSRRGPIRRNAIASRSVSDPIIADERLSIGSAVV